MKRIKYWTQNSWNRSQSLAYNMKVYNVIPKEFRDRVYELMQYEGFYAPGNMLINEFDKKNNYEWQAGFNGRSGGYLVLYRGGKRKDGTIYVKPGLNIEVEDVPVQVRKDFRQLAKDIVAVTIYIAKNAKLKEVEYTMSKKVLSFS